MTDVQKRSYRAMAFTFMGIAAAFALVFIAEKLFRFEFFSGNVLPMALFLAVIGALLLQTVRQSDRGPGEVQLGPEDESAEAMPDFTADAYKVDPYGPETFKPKLERADPKDYSEPKD